MNLNIDFPENRYKHCYAVGKIMYEYSKQIFEWPEEKAIEMFVLGNIHDIGYELEPDPFKHEEIIANSLSNSYKYYNEIKYHSKLQNKYQSKELDLLYFADMVVNGYGNLCTFEERLQDLKNRYGENSDVYIETEKIAQYLFEKGFEDIII